MGDGEEHGEYMNRPNLEQDDNALGPCDGCGGWINENQKFVRVNHQVNFNGAGIPDTEEEDEVYHSDCYIEMIDS